MNVSEDVMYSIGSMEEEKGSRRKQKESRIILACRDFLQSLFQRRIPQSIRNPDTAVMSSWCMYGKSREVLLPEVPGGSLGAGVEVGEGDGGCRVGDGPGGTGAGVGASLQ